jgi:hypothetical protein
LNTNVILECAPFAVNLAALLGARKPEDPLPKRLRLFKLGKNETSQGDFVVTEETIAQLSAMQRKLGRERVPIGFEHNIDEGSVEFARTSEPRQIAAKGATVLGVPGQGIDLDNIDWTGLGAQRIGDFEDISPTPLFDKASRRVVAILSASLTRTGSVFGLTLDNAAQARLSATLFDTTQNMNPTLSIAQLAGIFGLPENSTEVELRAAVAGLRAEPTFEIEVQENGAPKKLKLTGAQLASRLVKLETDYGADRQRSGAAEKGTLIAKLAANGQAPLDPDSGKPFSAAQLGAMDASTLRLLVSNTPATVPLTARARLSADPGREAIPDTVKGFDRVVAAFEREAASVAEQRAAFGA